MSSRIKFFKLIIFVNSLSPIASYDFDRCDFRWIDVVLPQCNDNLDEVIELSTFLAEYKMKYLIRDGSYPYCF